MKKIILLIVFLVLKVNLFSYWDEVTTIPTAYRNTVYLDVYFLPENPDLGWVCGFNSHVLKTTDGGQTWTGQSLPYDLQLETISFINENVGYTSGPENSVNQNYGYIFKTTDGGESWFDVSPEDNNFTLWGHHFIDENYGVVMGDGCYTDVSNSGLTSYYTTDGGNNWIKSQLNIDNQNVLYYSKFADPLIIDKNGLAYAVSSGVLWKSLDGGKSWSIYSYTGTYDWHEEISHYNGSIVVPSSPGCHGSYDTPADLRFSTDEGATWNIFQTNNVMYGTFLMDKFTAWGVGFDAEVYYTTDGGQNWELRNCGIDPDNDMDDVFFINDTLGFVVGQGIYKYNPKNPLAPEILSDSNLNICKGDTVFLSLDKDYKKIEWSNGENTKNIVVTEEGEYYAYAENSRCESGYTDTIEVNFYPDADYNIQKSIEGTLCDGDSLEIFIDGDFFEMIWQDGSVDYPRIITKDTILIFSVVSNDGCIINDTINIEFFPNTEIDITDNGRNILCEGYSLNLTATDGFIEYQWYKDNEPDIIGSKRDLSINEGGYYRVIGINEFGCASVSDSIFIDEVDLDNSIEFFIEHDNELDLGEVVYPELFCGNLLLYNKSDSDVTINQLNTIRNIEFSVPKAQLPITILAKDTHRLRVCYQASDIEIQRDSIRLPDICSDQIIPLVAEGIGYADTSDGRCEIPLEFELIDIIDEPFLDIRSIFPVPTGEILTIEFISGKTNSENKIVVEIFDNLGNKYFPEILINETKKTMKNGEISSGRIDIDCSKLNQGIYFIKINNGPIKRYEKFIISR